MVLGVPNEEDVPRGLGFAVVYPGRHVVVSRVQVPAPQVDQGEWFSPNVEIGDSTSL